jgi:hypothetical protein
MAGRPWWDPRASFLSRGDRDLSLLLDFMMATENSSEKTAAALSYGLVVSVGMNSAHSVPQSVIGQWPGWVFLAYLGHSSRRKPSKKTLNVLETPVEDIAIMWVLHSRQYGNSKMPARLTGQCLMWVEDDNVPKALELNLAP